MVLWRGVGAFRAVLLNSPQGNWGSDPLSFGLSNLFTQRAISPVPSLELSRAFIYAAHMSVASITIGQKLYLTKVLGIEYWVRQKSKRPLGMEPISPEVNLPRDGSFGDISVAKRGLALVTAGEMGLQKEQLLKNIVKAVKGTHVKRHHLEEPHQGLFTEPTLALFFSEKAAEYALGVCLPYGALGQQGQVHYAVTHPLEGLLGEGKEVLSRKKEVWTLLQELVGFLK